LFDVDEYKESDSSRDHRETSRKEHTSQDRNERREEKETSPFGLMDLALHSVLPPITQLTEREGGAAKNKLETKQRLVAFLIFVSLLDQSIERRSRRTATTGTRKSEDA
jgi:hypothetical protein